MIKNIFEYFDYYLKIFYFFSRIKGVFNLEKYKT